ncbi:MAG TPA: LysE family transporter [bacterium]
MATLASLFLSSFIVGFSGAIMPGTLLAATVAESARRGAKAGPLLVLGHGLLETALVVLLLVGLAPLFRQQAFFFTISLAGGAVLLWLAYGMFRSLPKLTLVMTGTGGSGRSPLLTGILMSLANPYWILWWASIGLGYILNSRRYGLAGVLFFFTGHLLADLTWYSAVSFSIGRGRRLFSDAAYRIIIGVCASALVSFAVYFLFKAACVLPFFKVN